MALLVRLFFVLLGLAALNKAARAVWRWIEQHPVWTGLILVGLLAFLVAWALMSVRADQLAAERAAEAEARQAELERSISSADGLSGTEFEQWFARLLARSGFTGIQVRGGAGDLGADVIAVTPFGARAVFQCKRHSRNVPSPEVQRFAGTCRAIHEADIAALVTTAGFTGPARDAAGQLDIVLVDRTALAAWAADRTPPAVFLGDNSAAA